MTQAQPIRVVEFANSGIAAAYAGWLLQRLGASVIRMESGPADLGNPLGLAAEALAIGKLPPPDNASLHSLLADADILLCDEPAKLIDAIGPLEGLAIQYPKLVVAVHSVFGLTGPYANAPAVALDAQAIGAVAWALGDPLREPLQLSPGIAEHQGGAMLAAGALLAHTLRERGHAAELVDVAMADVLASYVAGNCRFYIHHGMAWKRSGQRASNSGGAYPYVILPCADGEVCICGRTRDEWNRFVNAMGNPDWAQDPRYQNLRAMGRDYPEEVDALIKPWLGKMSKVELEKIAIANNLILSPVREMAEVIATPGFHQHGFYERTRIGGREVSVPTLPFRITQVRAEGSPDIASGLLEVPSKTPSADASPANRPLAGMRVIDFGWVWSAPWVGTILGELGADVIKVEHSRRPDSLRLSGRIFRNGERVEGPESEMSPMYHQVNHGKLGITLNAKEPDAVALLKRLVADADLVIENMSPGSMERVGLGYEDLKLVNPKLVMLAMSAAGQFGSLSGMRAYAPTMSSFAGMEALIGYPGEEPIGALNVGLGDPNASVHGLLAVLAAWRSAQATGRGCYIDLSQVEAITGVLRPYLLEAQIKGTQPTPAGNRHPEMAPHGIYPAKGGDRWVTIAVTDDDAWRAFVDLARDATLPVGALQFDRAMRIEQSDILDRAIAAWTATFDRDVLVAELRSVGVASSPVLSVEEMWDDPQMLARKSATEVEIPVYGPEKLFCAPWRFARFAPLINRPGPSLGEHNRAVFGTMLGLSDDKIDELIAAGVIA